MSSQSLNTHNVWFANEAVDNLSEDKLMMIESNNVTWFLLFILKDLIVHLVAMIVCLAVNT